MRLTQMMMAPPQLYYSGYPAQGAPAAGYDQSITASCQQGSFTRSRSPYAESSTPASSHVYFTENNESYFSL